MTRAPFRPALAAVVLCGVLALPPTRGIGIPVIELPLLLALLGLFGGVGWVVLTVALWLLSVQKLADLAMHQALGRGFNTVADMPLIPASMNLIAGSFGQLAAVGAALAAIIAGCCLLWLIWWATGVWATQKWQPHRRLAMLAVCAVALILPLAGQGAVENANYALSRIQLARQTVADLRNLRRAAAEDPYAGQAGLLDQIDRDVLVIFVESYGRASFDVEFLAERHRDTLQRAQARLEGAGLSVRSGFLSAPTQGGQSWLSHASFANGLWVSDQTRYRAVLASGRQSIFHLAGKAGFETAAVMPAITMPWPEAQRMGFDHILPARDLGYRGKPFNWVTMPDQFTLTATDRLLRQDPDRPHLFAQIALVSSHAPWTPVPHLLDWDAIGDGSEFNDMAISGDSPRDVWRDRDRVRRHYRDSVDYALRTALEYAERQGPDGPLIFLLGDHQAAPGIAMDDGRDVALHVIGPEDLVARTAGWGFTLGLIPPDESEAMPMDRMRDLILTGFTSGAAPS